MTTMATRPPASQSVPACVSAGNGAEGLTLVRNVSRRIVHVDMDAFYASVEQRDRLYTVFKHEYDKAYPQ